jgi:hypothetical protein
LSSPHKRRESSASSNGRLHRSNLPAVSYRFVACDFAVTITDFKPACKFIAQASKIHLQMSMATAKKKARKQP